METNINKIMMESQVIGIKIFIIVIGLVLINGCIGVDEKNWQKQPISTEKPAEGERVNEETKTKEAVNETKKSLLDILNLSEPQGYTVSYEIYTIISCLDNNRTVENVDTPMTKGTIYFASGEKIRIRRDYYFMSNHIGGIISNSLFLIGNESYNCVKTLEEWKCFILDAPIYIHEDSISKEIEENFEKSVYNGTLNISGVIAKCYKLEIDRILFRACYHTQKYIVLLTESFRDGKQKHKAIATSVNLSIPDDSIFILPAKPQKVE